ncbi:MAG: long-chain-fatty-acid--CoA ligase [Gammaproteobacteria bacterium]|nr:long-chain-fatty-acid--CoA ligase [Gammaproteobacteria bacterium]
MQGLMMDTQLLITSILHFAERNSPDTEIVSVTHDNPLFRYTYKDAFRRSRCLANVLKKLGLEYDTADAARVGTLAWNDHRHFELYYGVSCSGFVLHTINPRLFPEQVDYIINHAEDELLFVDPEFIPLLEKIRHNLTTLRHIIVLSDKAHMPVTNLEGVLCYEELLAGQSDEFDWPELSEQQACALRYTSGTTGNPKGVLYNHRATLLHAYASALPDAMNLSMQDCVMPLVPMFHVNAWGTPYSVPMTGGKLVLAGRGMADGEALFRLIETEGVTVSLGVPTVWLALLNWLELEGKTLSCLQRILVGGAACPESVLTTMRDKHGVYMHHGWGMTEMSPLGVWNTLKPGMQSLPESELVAMQLRQGRSLFGVELKIVDDQANELPWDGQTFGALKVRGTWVCNAYYGGASGDIEALDDDGWFATGDVATINADGYMLITDRSKDVIKSGGEWISSIDLENTAVNHPDVLEAAVIAVTHPKWSERPLLLVVRRPDADLSKQEILDWFDGKVASWWIPDAVEFVDQLPHTATGKLQKRQLRDEYASYVLPDSEG